MTHSHYEETDKAGKKYKETKKHKIASKMSSVGKLKEMLGDRKMSHQDWFKKHGLPK